VRHFQVVRLAAQANKAFDTLKERSGAALLSFLVNSASRLPGFAESLLQPECGVTVSQIAGGAAYCLVPVDMGARAPGKGAPTPAETGRPWSWIY
jgi:hypothetical protein